MKDTVGPLLTATDGHWYPVLWGAMRQLAQVLAEDHDETGLGGRRLTSQFDFSPVTQLQLDQKSVEFYDYLVKMSEIVFEVFLIIYCVRKWYNESFRHERIDNCPSESQEKCTRSNTFISKSNLTTHNVPIELIQEN